MRALRLTWPTEALVHKLSLEEAFTQLVNEQALAQNIPLAANLDAAEGLGLRIHDRLTEREDLVLGIMPFQDVGARLAADAQALQAAERIASRYKLNGLGQ